MKDSSTQILTFYGESNAGYLHAEGRLATTQLIEWLAPQPDEKILEIGTGTGATLTVLASLYPKTLFCGLEISDVMYVVAVNRLEFCFLSKKVAIYKQKEPHHLDFDSNSFDKIYIESVLAIQEGQGLSIFLHEIARVLKPNGLFILNETIWIDAVGLGQINTINTRCKAAFGVIQANSDYPYSKDWIRLFQQSGFEVNQEMLVSDLVATQSRWAQPLRVYLSDCYSLWGKIKSKCLPKMRHAWRHFEGEMAFIHKEGKPLMEGHIFKLSKKDVKSPQDKPR